MNFNLKEKIVIITGGAGLLGSRMVKIIQKNGGIPIIFDNDQAKINKLKKTFGNKNSSVHYYRVDITKHKQIKSTVNKVYNKFGKIDCLINNAGFNPKLGSKINNFENISLKQWNKEIKIGLTGSLITTQEVVKKMLIQKYGNIINISSDLGLIAPNQTIYGKFKKPISYSVIKHGIIGFSKYLATYFAKNKIRSNVICPGGILTNQNKNFRNKIKKLIPVGRMANIDDYDGIILYLCSDFSKYMTGSVISIDGGRTTW